MNPNRLKLLLGVAAVLLIVCVWKWIAGWGLVTVHVTGEPLSKVIRSIERQGGIEIVTSADPATPVTMDVDKVPAAEAVDTLAARLDGSWSVAYVTGATKADIAAGVAALGSGERNEDFRMFGFGMGGGGGMFDPGDTTIDPRKVSWTVSVSEDKQLHSYLEQVTMKTGVMAVAPKAWNPPVTKAPAGGKAASAIRSLVHSVRGDVKEVFVIRVWNREQFADRGNGGPRGGTDGGMGGGGGRAEGGFGGGGNGGGRQAFRPEWMEERVMARIAQLPAAEQEKAKKDFQEMRDFFQKMRDLPEDQRRTAMENFFNSPAVQQRMADREADRSEKSGPERRAQRARDYVQRKAAMKEQGASPSRENSP
jgi:hypothetical protein